jgi:polyphosphate glucokinase
MATTKQRTAARARTDAAKNPAVPGRRTLCIDIGGTGLKAMLLDAAGTELSERVRALTPHPATPAAVIKTLVALIAPLGEFDRVSVGFPGVVIDGVTKTAPNLGPAWQGFALAAALEEATKRPVRALNDAGVQGYGVVTGKGIEMLLTLGTGMGCALFVEGRYVPNLELAHHPLRKDKTYEDYVGAHALEECGKKKWNKHVQRVIATIQPVFNPRVIYLGGGNAKHVKIELPSNVKITPNLAGLLGGIALWHDAPT